MSSTTTERLQGADARESNIAAGTALADAIGTTLGPKGLDKMLVGASGTVVVTNDGASILDRMDIEHPAAELVVNVANNQATKVGDGTTTAVLLTAKLLNKAQKLFEKGLHPFRVTRGYRRASEVAINRLDSAAITVAPDDERRLRDAASTAVTGKWDDNASATFADLAVRAVRAVETDGTVDLSRITLRPVTSGGLDDSTLIAGLAVDMESSSTSIEGVDLPHHIEDATLALVDTELTIDESNAVSNVSVDAPSTLQALREFENDAYAAKVAAFVDADVNVVVCQKSIDDALRRALASEDILTVERTRQDEMHKLAAATDGELVTSVDELSPKTVGDADSVERRHLGNTDLLVVTENRDSQHVSLLLRGGTQHVVDESKRITENCIRVVTLTVESGQVLPGGGATELRLARELRDYADGVDDREQLAVRAFADALETVPQTLASTAGVDPIDALVELRARHHDGDHNVGLNTATGQPQSMVDSGVVEPLVVKQHAVANAEEAANMLLRIDDVIAAEHEDNGDETSGDHASHDHGSGGYPWAIGH
ncbi:thermosome subunit alpha [Halomicrococcus sp. NG-SE-24]|uniref:thermosome subunit alpha n=1 Tax=Halomicrococcus sp. NG-SE-24 TaxID=3436928 RepID=UPI003D9829D8